MSTCFKFSSLILIGREKKLRTLKHHGVWLIVLLLYTNLIHTSMSILECPFILDYDFPVSSSRDVQLHFT